MVDIGDAKLYCEIEGKGTPIVLLSGGPGNSHHAFHPYFSRGASFAEVIYYDQRGTGRSEQDPTGQKYTLRQAVDDLDALRAALGIERWIVVGHSYGGLLAQCYALKYPQHVLGMVLVCAEPAIATTYGPSRLLERISSEERMRIAAIYREKGLTTEQVIYNKGLNGDWKQQSFYRPSQEQLARMARYEWTPAPGFRDRILPDTHLVDLDGKFADFTLPTLLVEGRWDLTWGRDKPHRFKRNHPHGQLIVFERSAHSPFEDEPDRFFSLLASFAAAAEKRPASRHTPASKDVCPSPLAREIIFGRHQPEDAEELLKAAEAEPLRHSGAWVQLGVLLFQSERDTEALSVFQRVPKLPEPSPCDLFDSYVWQGHILDLMGRRGDAVAAYRQALKLAAWSNRNQWDQWGMMLNAEWVNARLERPFARTDTAQRILDLPLTGAGEQARVLFAQARAEGLNSGGVNMNLGLALYDGGYYAEALDAFRTLDRQQPELVVGVVWQGHILDLTGRREEALACYRKAKARGMQHPWSFDQYQIVIDNAWIEERLQTPFERK
jgi:proline iminopeptidase